MATHIRVFDNEAEVLNGLANYFVESAQQAIATNGRCSVVLSGGSSPKKLYELLASPMYSNKIEWDQLYFFFGDERYVPHTDPQSNYLMAEKALFGPLNIQPDHVFPMNTNMEPTQAALDYEQTIKAYFKEKEWRFDLMLLGLGDNSHTASLFPYTSVLNDTEPGVAALFIDEVNMYRITLNAPLINLSNRIAFLVYGEGKATAVRYIIKGEKNIPEHPAQLINTKGDLNWFLDKGAAKEL